MNKTGNNNLRTLDGFAGDYFEINREERNIAAILYHLLLINQNLEKIVTAYAKDLPLIHEELGIYFEYAYIRDLWNAIKSRAYTAEEEAGFKRKIILDLINPLSRNQLEQLSPEEFNNYYGAGRSYPGQISSPAVWSIQRFHMNIADPDEFLKTCKFKWCFNAKPDIVIHTSRNHAICIEAKFESGEGKYPTGRDRIIFQDKLRPYGKDRLVGQLEIQEYIMELLGIKAEFLFLVKDKPHGNKENVVTWSELFEYLDTSGCHPFIIKWVSKIRNANNNTFPNKV